ncbi:MAG: hypothetical protein KBS52_05020 [Clostridiales bacterium]|nr:hypothetical protein [Candidatus Equinaster intestinalis]
MFGYVRVYKPELRLKEWEMYKSVYCALCKKLGKDYGVFARFTLSYDFTFLACLKMSLEDSNCDIERKCCVFNPLKRCNYCKGIDGTLDFTCAGAMLLLYYKMLDNLKDEKGIKKAGYKIVFPFFRRARKKALKKYPELDEIFSEYIIEQEKVEADNSRSIDRASEPTAKMLSKLFAICGETDKEALSRLGYCVGRYIYIIDAALDYNEDIKKGRYNPYENSNAKETAANQLEMCINEAILAFNVINFKKMKNILGNIIYLGLEDTYKKEFEK